MAPGSNETSASSQRTPATSGGDSAVGLDFDPMSVIDGDDQQDMMNVSVFYCFGYVGVVMVT